MVSFVLDSAVRQLVRPLPMKLCVYPLSLFAMRLMVLGPSLSPVVSGVVNSFFRRCVSRIWRSSARVTDR
jgi:hypothetical protein